MQSAPLIGQQTNTKAFDVLDALTRVKVHLKEVRNAIDDLSKIYHSLSDEPRVKKPIQKIINSSAIMTGVRSRAVDAIDALDELN